MKIKINAPVTLTFVFLCLAATLLGIMSNGKLTQAFFMTYNSSLTDPLTYVRLVTHVIGHSGLQHFSGNVAYLLLLGPMLEEKYGGEGIVVVIVATAVITGLVNTIFFPGVGLCGASGVVFAFILLSSFTGFRKNEIPLTFILVALFFLGQQVYDGLFVADNISNTAHIVGGVIGSFIGFTVKK